MIGYGDEQRQLTRRQIEAQIAEAVTKHRMAEGSSLFIIPDNTRTAPIDIIFRVLYHLLADQVDSLDFLIALGTHPPLDEADILKRVGITAAEQKTKFAKARFFNHHWKDPQQLVSLGKISAEQIASVSGGLLKQDVEITVNRMVLEYDRVVIVGPTFPHEVVGFSGGNKYLFPGIAGQEIIDLFHWLGALITNRKIIGSKYTPVRRVVDMAAAMLPVPRLCMSLVVKDNGLAGLYIDSPEKAWEAAADLSSRLHIVYKENPFRLVLSRAPEMYDELWTGGKCMYKLEPVVADGGELIIYAPHITEVSRTHGKIIERIGYHVRDYFVKQPQRFVDVPGGVMAHSTHVKGAGNFENGVEQPRIRVTLATGIPEAVCRKINLGYRDPDSIDPREFAGREAEGVLYVPKAGEMLYRLIT